MLCGPAVRRCWKHSRQYTGRPCVGLNGTVVSFPHCEPTVLVSTRCPLPEPAVVPAERLALHALHRLGSFLKPLSAKNICSPAVKTNSAEHSAHFKTLSWYSIRCSKALLEQCGRVPGKFTPPSFPPAEPFEWTPVIWSPSLAHAVAFFGDAYARVPLWHGAFHLVSCSSCAF